MAKDGSWHKGVLIPFWVFEFLMALASIAMGSYYIDSSRRYRSYYSSSYYSSYTAGYIQRTLPGTAVAMTWAILTVIINVLQIVFFSRHTLGPVLVISTSAFTLGLYLVSALSLVGGSVINVYVWIFSVVLLALSLGKLIYSVVIYRRRKTTGYDPSRAFTTAPAGSYAQQPATSTA